MTIAVDEDHPDARACPGNGAVDDIGASDRARFGDREDLTDFCPSEHPLFERRLEQALHRGFDIVQGIVNNRVEPDVDVFLLRKIGRLRFGPDVESNDDRIGRRREKHVGFRSRGPGAAGTFRDGRQRCRRGVAHAPLILRFLEPCVSAPGVLSFSVPTGR